MATMSEFVVDHPDGMGSDSGNGDNVMITF